MNVRLRMWFCVAILPIATACGSTVGTGLPGTSAAPQRPTAALSSSTAIAARTTGYVAGPTTSVTRNAGRVILATYQAEGGANSVTTKTVQLDVERYLFWRHGTAVSITVSAAVGSDNVDPWRIVTDGSRGRDRRGEVRQHPTWSCRVTATARSRAPSASLQATGAMLGRGPHNVGFVDTGLTGEMHAG